MKSNVEFAEELKVRLRTFAIRIMTLVEAMPKTVPAWAIGKQIIRSGTSPFSNYRAACRAKSDKDFLNKLKIVLEEIDETGGWLELIEESKMFPKSKLVSLQQECEELTKIIQSSITTTRKRINSKLIPQNS